MLVNDSQEEHPVQTGITDHAVLIDDPSLAPILAASKMALPGRLSHWIFSAVSMRETSEKASVELGLADEAPALYTLRHGRASHGHVFGIRSRAEVKERGSLLTDAILRRYG